MNLRTTLYPVAAAAVIALAGSACGGDEVAPLASQLEISSAHANHIDPVTDPEILQWLADLRRATVAYRDFDAGTAAGWAANVLGCMELPGTGGMGEHYINVPVFESLLPEDLMPELLVYEPQKNGSKRLVALEWAVPIEVWGDEAPVLMGLQFHRNDNLGLWVLHAWIWKHNPAGIFADWNPVVTCDHHVPETE